MALQDPLFSMIAGALAPDRGKIMFAGTRIDGRRPDVVCRRGIGRTFQLVRPFPALRSRTMSSSVGCFHRNDVVLARRRAHEVLWHLRSVRQAAPARLGADFARPQAPRGSRGRWRPTPSSCCSTR